MNEMGMSALERKSERRPGGELDSCSSSRWLRRIVL